MAAPEPVACTLTTKDAAAQALEWVDLQSRARSVTELATGARITLPLQLTAQVEDLAAREATCCAFLTITTEAVDGELVLEVTSESLDGRPVVAALTGLTVDRVERSAATRP